jgi:hypothetical protein
MASETEIVRNIVQNRSALTSNARGELNAPEVVSHLFESVSGEVESEELKNLFVFCRHFVKILEECRRNNVDLHLRLLR